jgi:hypothetical protein
VELIAKPWKKRHIFQQKQRTNTSRQVKSLVEYFFIEFTGKHTATGKRKRVNVIHGSHMGSHGIHGYHHSSILRRTMPYRYDDVILNGNLTVEI